MNSHSSFDRNAVQKGNISIWHIQRIQLTGYDSTDVFLQMEDYDSLSVSNFISTVGKCLVPVILIYLKPVLAYSFM